MIGSISKSSLSGVSLQNPKKEMGSTCHFSGKIRSFSTLDLSNTKLAVLSPALGVAFGSYVGYKMVQNYSSEEKKAELTVPVTATYGILGGVCARSACTLRNPLSRLSLIGAVGLAVVNAVVNSKRL